MKVKIAVSCTWNVDNDYDEEIAKDLQKNKPIEILLDYLQDALKGDEDLTALKASVKIEE